MHKNRIVLAVTAIVVLALLFAGIGYAFNGTARTYNQGDEQTLAYMSVTPNSFDPIFTDAATAKTIFDSYVYNDGTTKAAYAFNETEETVEEVTVDATAYKAVKLNSTALQLTVLNETGAAISKINVAVDSTKTVGNGDFVFIFKLQVVGDAPDNIEYIVFNGFASANVNITTSIADTTSKIVAVTVYVGYEADVYVPNNYIGPAINNPTRQATVWTSGVTYYSDVACETEAVSQPTSQAELEASTFYEKLLPYKFSAAGPVDLASADFGIKVTDANAA